jgi:thiol-disulfide isomerase/thioredoxin
MSTRSSAVLLAMLLFACNTPNTASEADKQVASRTEADPLVGYDLRRLRPREQERLAVMFDRLRTEAGTEGKQVVVLFSADWCEPCKHLDLELGNTHPESMIGHVRIIELKEDDWAAAARMDEFNDLRRRWEPMLGSYPLVIRLDGAGKRAEEMKEAKDRLEQQGLDPTLPLWFSSFADPA